MQLFVSIKKSFYNGDGKVKLRERLRAKRDGEDSGRSEFNLRKKSTF
jgi:hypothetical protein